MRSRAEQVAAVLICPHRIRTARGEVVIETARVDGNRLILTGRGVIDDPGTPDDSWVWHIVNPPLTVERGTEIVPLDALRAVIEGQ